MRVPMRLRALGRGGSTRDEQHAVVAGILTEMWSALRHGHRRHGEPAAGPHRRLELGGGQHGARANHRMLGAGATQFAQRQQRTWSGHPSAPRSATRAQRIRARRARALAAKPAPCAPAPVRLRDSGSRRFCTWRAGRAPPSGAAPAQNDPADRAYSHKTHGNERARCETTTMHARFVKAVDAVSKSFTALSCCGRERASTNCTNARFERDSAHKERRRRRRRPGPDEDANIGARSCGFRGCALAWPTRLSGVELVSRGHSIAASVTATGALRNNRAAAGLAVVAAPASAQTRRVARPVRQAGPEAGIRAAWSTVESAPDA
eukprot:ctg_3712.g434